MIQGLANHWKDIGIILNEMGSHQSFEQLVDKISLFQESVGNGVSESEDRPEAVFHQGENYAEEMCSEAIGFLAILTAESTGFPDRLDMQHGREKMTLKFFGLRNQTDRVVIYTCAGKKTKEVLGFMYVKVEVTFGWNVQSLVIQSGSQRRGADPTYR